MVEGQSGKRPWRQEISARQARGHRGFRRFSTNRSDGRNVLDLPPAGTAVDAFGVVHQEINGHDLTEFWPLFKKAAQTKGKPSAIVAEP